MQAQLQESANLMPLCAAVEFNAVYQRDEICDEIFRSELDLTAWQR
jgi:hypothetical protein